MARRVQPRSTLSDNFKLMKHVVPWRLLLLVPFLLIFAIPAFLLGTGAGHRLLPGLTNYFFNLSNTKLTAVPTPMPPLTALLPQPGSIVYHVLNGDACDEILTSQMHMNNAGQIFADVKPNTVQALNSALGQNCLDLQPGDVVTLMPQYPLAALGGLILKVDALSAAQPIPTPLIHVQQTQQKPAGVDCTNGCLVTTRIASGIEVKFSLQTSIPVPVGGWIWAQAMMPRKSVPHFGNYPYVDPAVSLNGSTLSVCDVQINDMHDDNSLTCDQLQPNTINDDGGAWLFGVTGRGSLDHWYRLHLPTGVRVLLWLSVDDNGILHYRSGNSIYRYDETLHLYVRIR